MRFAVLVLPFAVAACSPSIETLEITPPKLKITAEADTKTLVATPKDKDGNAIDGKVVTWTSSDPAVASIDASGKVKPAGTGKATMTATVEEKTGTAEVEVLLLKSIKLETPAMVIKVGVPNQALKIAFMNEKGDPLALPDAKVEWKTADPNIATVGTDGVIAGVAAGSTTITARVNELKADVAVTVNPADPPADAGPAAADAGAASPGAPAP
jgi:uncharacterized protein YjdB